jgi:hypothetical protein
MRPVGDVNKHDRRLRDEDHAARLLADVSQ